MSNTEKAPAVLIDTWAYNSENYIRECAESVLNQSFSDFEWVVLDNGSTDKTGEILEEYARKDSRIKLFRNPKNSFVYNEPFNPDYVQYIENMKSEYWCTLDSDDYLHPDFLRELYTAAKKYDADIAVGGTEMFREDNPQIRGTRCPPDFYTGDITRLGDILPQIYGCFRPIWGKLFKTSLVKKRMEYRKKHPLRLLHGGDTLYNLDCLTFAHSVVGINKVLHHYRIRSSSYYHTQVDQKRYLDYKIIYDVSKKLLQRWNKLNDNNLAFIAGVLYYSIKDCIEIAANAKSISLQERLDVITTICNDPEVYQVLAQSGFATNLFLDVQKTVEKMVETMAEDELSDGLRHYMCRLFTSVKMATSPLSNKQNAFLLYLSSLCDETNKTRFGSVVLYSFLKFAGKTALAELEHRGIKSEFLAANPVLLRELVNFRIDEAIQICQQHTDDGQYHLLKQELKRLRGKFDLEPIHRAKKLIEQLMSDGKIAEAVDLLVKVLEFCPLDKELLCYKLYFLTLQGDVRTLLETAEVLRVFYPDDSTAMTMVAHAFVYAGQKERAKEAFRQALNVCSDEAKRMEIARELEVI